MSRPKVVIVGAGFAGMKMAHEFSKKDVDVTLIDRHNFHLFAPLLYQVSTSLLDSDEVAHPVRASFRGTDGDFFMAKVTGVDFEKKEVLTAHGEIPYDYLVLSAGSTTNFFGMENVKKYSYGMKTLQEAERIKNHILHMFERADKCDDEAERRKMLTFVCVGGGPTGIEEAGSIAEIAYLIMPAEYRHISVEEIKVILIEATDKVLAMVDPSLQEATVKTLEKKGVEVRKNTQVVDCSEDGLTLKTGEFIPTRTVIWAAGVRAVNFVRDLDAEHDRGGRIVVDEKLHVPGKDGVYAVGDCASFMHYGDKRPLPTIAPVATHQAAVCVENIMNVIAGKPEKQKDFHYKDLGTMATIGRCQAVAQMPNGMKLTGFPAWCAWMFVHLWRLTGAHSNVTVLLKWTWNLISGTRLGRIITNIDIRDQV